MHTRHRAPKQTLYSIIFRRVKCLEAIIHFFGWDSSQMVNTDFSTLIDRNHVTKGKGTTKKKATDNSLGMYHCFTPRNSGIPHRIDI